MLELKSDEGKDNGVLALAPENILSLPLLRSKGLAILEAIFPVQV